eukprot:SAG31_NODE_335_length_17509_cov_7.127972_3_plen_71_part_00
MPKPTSPGGIQRGGGAGAVIAAANSGVLLQRRLRSQVSFSVQGRRGSGDALATRMFGRARDRILNLPVLE